MKRFLRYFGIFGLGAAAGSAITAYVVRKKMTEDHENEINQIRDHYLKTNDVKVPEETTENTDGGDDVNYNDPALMATTKPVHPHDPELDESLKYIEYHPTPEEEALEENEEEKRMTDEEFAEYIKVTKRQAWEDTCYWKYDPEDPHCDDLDFEHRVSPMRPDNMGEGDYDVVSVDWYHEHGVMTDENGNVIPEAMWDKVMGQDWKCAFAYHESSVAVVRNQYLHIDYEISMVDGDPPNRDEIERELYPLPDDQFVDVNYSRHPRTYRSRFGKEFWPKEWLEKDEEG